MELMALIDWMYYHTTIDMDALASLARHEFIAGDIEAMSKASWNALNVLVARVEHLQSGAHGGQG